MTTALCPSCKSGSEVTIHALWTCPSLLVVWSNDEMLTKHVKYKFNDFSDLLGMVFLMKDRIDPNLLAICFWLVWSKRNSDRLGEPSVALGRIRAKAATLLHDFRTAQLLQPMVSTIVARAARCTPPLPPHLKINFDGATFKELGCAGIGVVVQNSTGAVIGALSQRIMMPSSAAIVELLACRKALFFAKDLGVVQCIVEGDAEVIIKALRQKDSSHPEFGHVIQDVLFLANDFQSCCFSHVNRIGNVVAHCLARSSKSGNELQVWYNTTPEDIAPLVTSDSL